MENNRKKILFVSRAYGEQAGGMERLSFELITGFQNDPAFDVSTVIHTGARAASPVFMITSLWKVLRQARNVDIVHIGDPLLSLTGFLCKKILKKKVAVTVHGLDITYANPFYQLYLKLFFRHLDIYLPISRYVASLLKDQHAPTGKISVSNPGLHDQYYDPSVTKEDAQKVIGQDIAGKILLYTNGRLTKRKGHTWFVQEVLPHLPENVLYVISGKGKEEKNIKAVNTHKRAILLGRISQKDVITLYNTCDAFVQPNIFMKGDVEGFGLVVLEAASCARPVFAADTEGLSDAITNGKNGRLLPSGDAKQWIAALTSWIQSDMQNRSDAILARTYTLEKFSWDKVLTHYKEVLRSGI